MRLASAALTLADNSAALDARICPFVTTVPVAPSVPTTTSSYRMPVTVCPSDNDVEFV